MARSSPLVSFLSRIESLKSKHSLTLFGAQEDQVNKQLADKERVAAALVGEFKLAF